MHMMDVRSGKWERANTQGEPPSPRAAHAAAAVGSMVVVQVSTVGGGLHVHVHHYLIGLHLETFRSIDSAQKEWLSLILWRQSSAGQLI